MPEEAKIRPFVETRLQRLWEVRVGSFTVVSILIKTIAQYAPPKSQR